MLTEGKELSSQRNHRAAGIGGRQPADTQGGPQSTRDCDSSHLKQVGALPLKRHSVKGVTTRHGSKPLHDVIKTHTPVVASNVQTPVPVVSFQGPVDRP